MRIKYFGWMRQYVGMPEEVVDLAEFSETSATISELADWLMTRSAGHARAFAQRDQLRVAIDREFAEWGDHCRPQAEIAFLPPITGG